MLMTEDGKADTIRRYTDITMTDTIAAAAADALVAKLLEREKGNIYFAFDTRELTRGDIAQRYNAYATGLSSNFLQLDEVRAMEDLPPLGINFVTLGLNDVLLDPKTGQIYTPNTNQYATMGENAQIPLTDEGNGGNIDTEVRQEIHDPKTGKIIDNVPDRTDGIEVSRKVFSHINESNDPDVTAEQFIMHHDSLKDVTPKQVYDLLIEMGFEVEPLGKGKYKGVSFENGGGYSIHFHHQGYFQYHPKGGIHRVEYWKICSGKVRENRYDRHGNKIEVTKN